MDGNSLKCYIYGFEPYKILEATTPIVCGWNFISTSQLCRLFRSELGMSPIEYRTSVRIKVAEGMLRGSYESITSVAEACGYESIYAFSKAFRLATGMSPTEWSKAPELK